jgi:hypothetical protein
LIALHYDILFGYMFAIRTLDIFVKVKFQLPQEILKKLVLVRKQTLPWQNNTVFGFYALEYYLRKKFLFSTEN